MRTRTCALGLLTLGTVLALAPAGEPAKAAPKKDYADLSRVVQKMMAAQFPKTFEDNQGWGQTVPLPPGRLRLDRLRTRILVNGREELPDGSWRKLRAGMADPQRDLKVRVLDFQKKADNVYRLTLEIEAPLSGEVELQRWRKGLRLLHLFAEGDAVLGLTVGCDVKVSLDPKQPFGKVQLAPQVTDLQPALKDFTLKRVSLRRLGPVLEGEQARQAGEQIKGMVEDTLRSAAPRMKDRFNEELARGTAEGKGGVPVGDLLKAIMPRPKKD